jgi:hypothetical protein
MGPESLKPPPQLPEGHLPRVRVPRLRRCLLGALCAALATAAVRQASAQLPGSPPDSRTDTTSKSSVPQGLPAVAVTAPAPIVNYRLVDFERHKRTGLGQYLTDEEIRSSNASNLQDATRGMRGVNLHCGGSEFGGCRIQMVRAPINCQPEYVVDGRVDNVFGPLTPIRDIVALEIYTGAADVPGEFAGPKAGCGVVVIWTRSAPARRQR